MDETVTGARVELVVTVDVPGRRLWDLVSDVTRIGEWSPECVFARRLDGGGARPRPGTRFEGLNRYPDGQAAWVLCQVTEAVRPGVFAWAALDERGDPRRPASLWRYELAPAVVPGRTRVRHVFEHGPGNSGLREAARRDPASLAGRLAELRRNMAATLAAMAREDREDHTANSLTEEER
ncbi:SRPBCC family protein [Streptomyces nanhaiensis]|uniref:SRPBCC family protein n=1 Tax=Streptomyces nanhaiensis TaxID=679319 RepID=UPI00399D4425